MRSLRRYGRVTSRRPIGAHSHIRSCHPYGTLTPQNSPMAAKARTDLTSLQRLEAQIRALQEGTPQGAAWEAAPNPPFKPDNPQKEMPLAHLGRLARYRAGTSPNRPLSRLQLDEHLHESLHRPAGLHTMW